MQEQPPSEPTRREPAAGGRRRSPKATFTPPPAPPEPAGEPDTGTRPTRRAKPAPVVLFQPPEVDEVLPRQKAHPVPAESPALAGGREPPAPAGGTSGAAGDLPHTPADATAEPPGPADAVADPPRPARPEPDSAQPVAEPQRIERPAPDRQRTRQPAPEQASEAATTTRPGAKRAAPPKKAAPAKRATPTRQAAPAKKTSPVAPAPNTTEDGTTSGEDTSPTGPAPASDMGTRPRKVAARAKTAASKKATPASGPVAPAAPPTERTAAGIARATEAPDLTPGPDVEPASGRTPGSELGRVGRKVLDHPGFAPELLALAAVEAVGPQAREWAARLRSAYPDAGDDGLARLATRRFVRQAGAGGAVAAVAGLLAPVAELAAVLWTQANLVLHVAAAYGRDPGHPDRAVELLVLTQVHPDALSARAALAAARDLDAPGAEPWARVAEAAWRLATPLAAQAGGWLALRVASRLLPGAALVAAATGDAAAAERLAARAVAAYRPARAR